MRPLAAAGLAATKEGAEGGYALAQPAADITLSTVAEAAMKAPSAMNRQPIMFSYNPAWTPSSAIG